VRVTFYPKFAEVDVSGTEDGTADPQRPPRKYAGWHQHHQL